MTSLDCSHDVILLFVFKIEYTKKSYSDYIGVGIQVEKARGNP